MVTGVLENKIQPLYFTKEETEAAEGKGPAGSHGDCGDRPRPLAFGSFSGITAFFALSLFFFGRSPCGILVPQAGIKPMPPAVEAMEAWSLNQQTPKEAPLTTSLDLQRLSVAG